MDADRDADKHTRLEAELATAREWLAAAGWANDELRAERDAERRELERFQGEAQDSARLMSNEYEAEIRRLRADVERQTRHARLLAQARPGDDGWLTASEHLDEIAALRAELAALQQHCLSALQWHESNPVDQIPSGLAKMSQEWSRARQEFALRAGSLPDNAAWTEGERLRAIQLIFLARENAPEEYKSKAVFEALLAERLLVPRRLSPTPPAATPEGRMNSCAQSAPVDSGSLSSQEGRSPGTRSDRSRPATKSDAGSRSDLTDGSSEVPCPSRSDEPSDAEGGATPSADERAYDVGMEDGYREGVRAAHVTPQQVGSAQSVQAYFDAYYRHHENSPRVHLEWFTDSEGDEHQLYASDVQRIANGLLDVFEAQYRALNQSAPAGASPVTPEELKRTVYCTDCGYLLADGKCDHCDAASPVTGDGVDEPEPRNVPGTNRWCNCQAPDQYSGPYHPYGDTETCAPVGVDEQTTEPAAEPDVDAFEKALRRTLNKDTNLGTDGVTHTSTVVGLVLDTMERHGYLPDSRHPSQIAAAVPAEPPAVEHYIRSVIELHGEDMPIRAGNLLRFIDQPEQYVREAAEAVSTGSSETTPAPTPSEAWEPKIGDHVSCDDDDEITGVVDEINNAWAVVATDNGCCVDVLVADLRPAPVETTSGEEAQ